MVIGSILIGADDIVGEMVKQRIPNMRGEWGPFTALGVVRRGQLVGGWVYHSYIGFDVQLSAAFDGVGWALPGTLRALFNYPFNELGVRRMTAITGRSNHKARKALKDLGFTLEGVAKHGLDGHEDAFIFRMLREECRWIGHGRKQEISPEAARAA